MNSACSYSSTLQRREQLYVYRKRKSHSRPQQDNYGNGNTGKQRGTIRRLLSRLDVCHLESMPSTTLSKFIADLQQKAQMQFHNCRISSLPPTYLVKVFKYNWIGDWWAIANVVSKPARIWYPASRTFSSTRSSIIFNWSFYRCNCRRRKHFTICIWVWMCPSYFSHPHQQKGRRWVAGHKQLNGYRRSPSQMTVYSPIKKRVVFIILTVNVAVLYTKKDNIIPKHCVRQFSSY